MTREEAERIIREYIPQKPTAYYYHDPYDDGKYCGSGWRYEYPPIDSKLVDALIERDKNCKPYVSDDEIGISEEDAKFNAEMEKRFTDLMNRGNKANSAIEEYRKKNSHYYSMVTEYLGDQITVIPMTYMSECEFKEKARGVCDRLGLRNCHVYCYNNKDDVKGKEVYGYSPWCSNSIDSTSADACDNVIRFCDKFERYAKNVDKDLLNKTLSETRHAIATLKLLANVDYINRIKEYSQQYDEI